MYVALLSFLNEAKTDPIDLETNANVELRNLI